MFHALRPFLFVFQCALVFLCSNLVLRCGFADHMKLRKLFLHEQLFLFNFSNIPPTTLTRLHKIKQARTRNSILVIFITFSGFVVVKFLKLVVATSLETRARSGHDDDGDLLKSSSTFVSASFRVDGKRQKNTTTTTRPAIVVQTRVSNFFCVSLRMDAEVTVAIEN